MAGLTESEDGDVSGLHSTDTEDVWVVKLSESGDIEWQKCLGGSHKDEGYSIQQTSDGGFICAGLTESNDGDVSGNHGTSGDGWVIKLDATGTIQWQRCLGGGVAEEFYLIQQTMDGGFMTAGLVTSDDGDVSGFLGGSDAWIVKLNAAGTIQWQRCMGGISSEWARSVQQTADGGHVLVGGATYNDGDVSGFHGGGSDVWVVKFGPVVGIAEGEEKRFTITPNPSSSNIVIRFGSNARPQYNTLRDATGRVVLEHSIVNISRIQLINAIG